ncbi:MAG: hypothetical protein COS14_09670 [Bacteroidetes bacterium CG02_land_8_20_14_3_00_31_25]|nr:hypothetical protein [Bacteroidota bacterium]PIV58430.1 MAG: hypothetical protein COS14_09670 [Bacteroidetes bacterium CG02_land_8_20_14_3_00_31_25]PIX33300.1 MAG: hypothetical protein COZ59_09590 [Bacteroidetes bacterium CG_4_8_14_3_um_filter_31_14]PIY06089.1 MAG: hypothetical protein COZ21_03335 [Bacteroidetes bacterium CG_4_10_14_3_um_filter_31_20]
MEESKNENSCGCGTNENSSCCTPKSFNKRMWTTIIFVVVILFAGLLISYKMFCPMACKGDGACAKDSVASCCADKNMQNNTGAVPSCCAGKNKKDSTITLQPDFPKK